MRYFPMIVLLVSLSVAVANATVVSRIAAVVNKDIITTYQLDEKLQEELARRDKQPSPAQLGALRQELLSRLIEETLLQQRIEALHLTVSEEEIETALRDVEKKNQLTRTELKDAVLLQGLNFDEYRDNLRQQILRYKLISEEVRSQVDVPESEVVDYYRAHLDEYRLPPEVHLSAIIFPIPEKASEQERAKIRAIAEEALGHLKEGEDLTQVASRYTDAYGATGREMGQFAYGDLIPEFIPAIAGVATGSYTEPVEAAGSIYVLRVDERLSGGLRQFNAVKNEIYQMILDQKTDARLKEWVRVLKARAFIDIRL
ncbi:MAG: SurA N-terminal domain-containing protein [Desulfuromonadales bacterium]|jgi:peptidyl-prolyl cis-trans isomerase SurA